MTGEPIQARVTPADPASERDAAIRTLWEAATDGWDSDAELWDSSTAYPGTAMRGRELWRIGAVLGLVDTDEDGYPEENA